MNLRKTDVVAIVFLVVFAGTLAAVGVYLVHHDVTRAHAGDCVEASGRDSLTVVGCADPDADYKVVRRVEHVSRNESDAAVCGVFDRVDRTYWEAPLGVRRGFVLCLVGIDRPGR